MTYRDDLAACQSALESMTAERDAALAKIERASSASKSTNGVRGWWDRYRQWILAAFCVFCTELSWIIVFPALSQTAPLLPVRVERISLPATVAGPLQTGDASYYYHETCSDHRRELRVTAEVHGTAEVVYWLRGQRAPFYRRSNDLGAQQVVPVPAGCIRIAVVRHEGQSSRDGYLLIIEELDSSLNNV